MLRVFQTDIADPAHFTVTLELVPGRESTGRAVDTVMVKGCVPPPTEPH